MNERTLRICISWLEVKKKIGFTWPKKSYRIDLIEKKTVLSRTRKKTSLEFCCCFYERGVNGFSHESIKVDHELPRQKSKDDIIMNDELERHIVLSSHWLPRLILLSWWNPAVGASAAAAPVEAALALPRIRTDRLTTPSRRIDFPSILRRRRLRNPRIRCKRPDHSLRVSARKERCWMA